MAALLQELDHRAASAQALLEAQLADLESDERCCLALLGDDRDAPAREAPGDGDVSSVLGEWGENESPGAVAAADAAREKRERLRQALTKVRRSKAETAAALAVASGDAAAEARENAADARELLELELGEARRELAASQKARRDAEGERDGLELRLAALKDAVGPAEQTVHLVKGRGVASQSTAGAGTGGGPVRVRTIYVPAKCDTRRRLPS